VADDSWQIADAANEQCLMVIKTDMTLTATVLIYLLYQPFGHV